MFKDPASKNPTLGVAGMLGRVSLGRLFLGRVKILTLHLPHRLTTCPSLWRSPFEINPHLGSGSIPPGLEVAKP